MKVNKLAREHERNLGVAPVIIGIYWQRPYLVIRNILKAIETKKPYNEYELLTKKEQNLFDNGELVF